MKVITELELLLINGGLNYFGTLVTVTNPNIPEPIFNDIENASTQTINGNWEYSYTIAYLCANGRMPHYVNYKDALEDALFEVGFFN